MPQQRRSVATIVTLSLVTVTTVVLGAFATLNVISDRDRDLGRLKAEAAMHAEQVSTGLALPLWNFDHTQIDRVIDSAMQNRAVAGIVVAGAGKVHARTRNAQGGLLASDGHFPTEGLLREERPITAGDDVIGRVTLYMTPKFVEAESRRALFFFALLILSLDLLLALCHYLVLRQTVLEPLAAVDRYARQVSSGVRNDLRLDDTWFYGEISSLRASLERMVSLLDTRYADLQRTTDEVITAKEEAEAAVQVRDDFLSIASHELRTPLTALQFAVQGLSRILHRHVPEQADTYTGPIDIVLRQVSRMTLLVNALLDVTRIQGGFFAMDVAPCDLMDAVEKSVALLAQKLEVSGSVLNVHGPDKPVVGLWQHLRMEQLVTNLLDNAIKYGRGRPIDLTVTLSFDHVRLEVSDQGLGIPPERQARIFDRFERAVSTQNYGGLGLGLFICRSIVQTHGGEISVSSEEGVGSRFTVDLPLRPVATAAP